MSKHEQFMDAAKWDLAEEQRKAELRIAHAKAGYKDIDPNEVARLTAIGRGEVASPEAVTAAEQSQTVAPEAKSELPSVGESLFLHLKAGGRLNSEQQQLAAGYIMEQCAKVESTFYGFKRVRSDIEFLFNSLHEYGLEACPIVDDKGKKRLASELLKSMDAADSLREESVENVRKRLGEGVPAEAVRYEMLTKSAWNSISNIKLPGYTVGLREFLVDDVIHEAKLAKKPKAQAQTPDSAVAASASTGFVRVGGDADIDELRRHNYVS